MKKVWSRKAVSFFLVLIIVTLSLVTPVATAFAAEDIPGTKVVNGMVISKKVEKVPDVDDKYKITLSAYSTGESVAIETSRPVDIVIAVDQSSSMGSSGVRAIKSAVNAFLTKVAADAKSNDVNHRVALVGYSDGPSGYTGTELFIGSKHYNFGKASESSSTYQDIYTLSNRLSNSTYYSNRNELYQKVNGEYKKISVSRDRDWFTDPYEYTYTFSNGAAGETVIKSTNAGTVPNLPIDVYVHSQKTLSKTAPEMYGSAFQDVLVGNGVNPEITASVNQLDSESDTYPQYAIDMASGIFNAYSSDYSGTNRGKVVIFFTDGRPAAEGDTYTASIANDAINKAYALKTSGVTIFTVGCFSGANDSTPAVLPANSTSGSGGYNRVANRFLYLMSSYYPHATSMSDTGEIIAGYENIKYYISQEDSGDLNQVFEKIATYIHTVNTTLNEKAYIKDVITPYFSGPSNVNEISAYYQMCTGIDSKDNALRTFSDTKIPAGSELDVSLESYDSEDDGDPAEIGDVPNDTVIVTNFNYKENWCGLLGGNPHGKKLVIEFYITVREGFLGGNGAPTNQPISGIYDEDGNPVPGLDFPMPEKQDIAIDEINYEVIASRKDVYLYHSLTEDDMLKVSTIKAYNKNGSVSCVLELDKENYGVEKWRTELLDIDISFPDASNYQRLTADTKYYLESTIAPIYDGAYEGTSKKSADTDVWVYRPRLTYQDSLLKFGEIPDYDKDNLVKIDWVHKNDKDVWVTSDQMIGTEPKLRIVYDKDPDKFNTDTYVNVSQVLMDVDNNGTYETDITDFCLFAHDTCDYERCHYDGSNGDFVVHITDGIANLVIKNTGDTVDENATFLFDVTCPDDPTFKQSVIVKGTGSVVITGLVPGTYVVKQDTSWSPEYTCNSTNPQEKLLVAEASTGRNNVVTFNNSKKASFVRTAYDYIRNLFKSDGIERVNGFGRSF